MTNETKTAFINPLSEMSFLILLCIAKNNGIHGYGIRKFLLDIGKETHFDIKFQNSYIYYNINKFLEEGYIYKEDFYTSGVIKYYISPSGKERFHKELVFRSYILDNYGK